MTRATGDCPLCGEPVADGSDAVPINTEDGRRAAHRECMLREVLGGIGHITNHAYWCGQMHDPDGGMTRRESALAVDHWVHEHGVEAAAAISTGAAGEGSQGMALRAERDRIATIRDNPRQ